MDYDKAMKLPDGLTCNDCQHVRRCVSFGYSNPERTQCDFYPNQFVPKVKAESTPQHER